MNFFFWTSKQAKKNIKQKLLEVTKFKQLSVLKFYSYDNKIEKKNQKKTKNFVNFSFCDDKFEQTKR